MQPNPEVREKLSNDKNKQRSRKEQKKSSKPTKLVLKQIFFWCLRVARSYFKQPKLQSKYDRGVQLLTAKNLYSRVLENVGSKSYT